MFSENNEDEEQGRSSTVDEIVNMALNSKSLLQGRLRRRRQSNDAVLVKQTNFNPKEKDIDFNRNQNCLSSIEEDNNYQNRKFTVPASASKITRSVSTPEINFKFKSYSTQKPNTNTSRKVDFSGSNFQNFRLSNGSDKENEEEKSGNIGQISYSGTNSHSDILSLTSKSCTGEKSDLRQKYNSLFKSVKKGEKKSQVLQNKSDSIAKSVQLPSMTPYQNRDSYSNWSNCNSSTKNSFGMKNISPVKKLVFTRELLKPLTSTTNLDKTEPSKEETKNYTGTGILTHTKTQETTVLCKAQISSSALKESSTLTTTADSSSSSLLLSNSDLIVIKGEKYLKLDTLGKGGSSVVYKVFDLSNKTTKAVKVVSLSGIDESCLESYKNEIKFLERLQYSPRVIKIFACEITDTDLKMVLEAGSIDLATILNDSRKSRNPILPFTIKHYWQAMLMAVQDIHNEGIIHLDLKPANFILVSNTLKLIDFGIASSIQQDMTSVFKESQAGTFNYMSPESLRDISSGSLLNCDSEKPTIKLGVKSDVWSLGCILYNLVYGRTPFQHIVKPLLKLAAISNPNTKISFPPLTDMYLMDVLEKCLQFEPSSRPSIKELLQLPYLKGSLHPSPSKQKS